ncbi:hypothetical protein ACFL5Z_14925 [Planctomycetota bacterium]
MMDDELIECIENPLVREFLLEYLEEFVDDVQVFSKQILAYVPPEGKSFVTSSGLAFISTPIVNFMPDLPWQTIKMEITNAVSEVFYRNTNDQRYSQNGIPGAADKNHREEKLIKQAIVAAFASICKSAEDAMGTILIGGVANLLGKYVALCIARILDEIVEYRSWPIVQIPLTGPAQKRSTD